MHSTCLTSQRVLVPISFDESHLREALRRHFQEFAALQARHVFLEPSTVTWSLRRLNVLATDSVEGFNIICSNLVLRRVATWQRFVLAKNAAIYAPFEFDVDW
jgi:hypothetical protein